MKAVIPKKIAMAAIYCLIGHVINTFIETLLGYNGVGYTTLSVLIVGAALCASSRHMRVGKLKANHKGDASTEKTVFNSTLKNKIKFILGTPDFKVEAVLFVIISFLLFLIPNFTFLVTLGVKAVFSNSANLIYFILWMLLMPIYMAVLDVVAWISAYNRCYKRREF